MSEFTKIILTTFFGLLAGFFIAVFAEPLRRWIFRSVVTLSFQPRIGFGRRWISLTTTSAPGVMAKYIRVSAKCTSRICLTANRCRPFLTKVEKHDSGTNSYKELHHDPIPLHWAYIGDQQLDIHPGMEFFFDVAEVNSLENLLRPQTTVFPVPWAEILREPGRYKFSVMLSGENIKPVPRTIEFEWKGSFDAVTEDCFE